MADEIARIGDANEGVGFHATCSGCELAKVLGGASRPDSTRAISTGYPALERSVLAGLGKTESSASLATPAGLRVTRTAPKAMDRWPDPEAREREA